MSEFTFYVDQARFRRQNWRHLIELQRIERWRRINLQMYIQRHGPSCVDRFWKGILENAYPKRDSICSGFTFPASARA